MIDEIAIVSVAGVILWSWANPELSASRGLERMINSLFKDVLLREGRTKEPHYDTMTCRMKWRRSESRGLVVVASYDKELARSHDFSYIDKVVASVAKVSASPATARHPRPRAGRASHRQPVCVQRVGRELATLYARARLCCCKCKVLLAGFL